MHSNSDIIFGIPWVPCVAAVLKQNLRNIFWERNNLFKSLHYIKPPIVILEKNTLTNFLLSGSHRYKKIINAGILKSTIIYSRTLTFQKKKYICLTESPLKMMKNAFYSVLKALFVLKIYLNFCLDFLVILKKRLD